MIALIILLAFVFGTLSGAIALAVYAALIGADIESKKKRPFSKKRNANE